MTDRMRAYFLLADRGDRLGGLIHGALDQGVDAEAGDRLAADIEEHRGIRGTVEARPKQSTQHFGGIWPERTQTNLVTLSQESHRGCCSQIERGHFRASGFVGAGPGVVEEEQEGVVPLALRTPAVRRGEQGIDLYLFEVGHRWRNRAAHGDTLDLSGHLHELGHLPADETEQRMDRGKPLVPCCHGVAPPLLQVKEKGSDDLRAQVFDDQTSRFRGVVFRHEEDQQADRIAIAFLGVVAQVPIGDDVFKKKATDVRPERVLVIHEAAPPLARHTVGSVAMPRPAAPLSWLDRSVFPRR